MLDACRKINVHEHTAKRQEKNTGSVQNRDVK